MKYTKEAADFLVYCIEMYKNKYSLSGKETQALLNKPVQIYIFLIHLKHCIRPEWNTHCRIFTTSYRRGKNRLTE